MGSNYPYLCMLLSKGTSGKHAPSSKIEGDNAEIIDSHESEIFLDT